MTSPAAASTPIPIKDMGIYFDGNDNLEIEGIMLNVSFTIQLWVRIVTAGPLFSIHRDVNGESSRLLFKSQTTQTQLLTDGFTSISSTSYALRKWTLLAVSASWSDPDYTIRFFSSQFGVSLVTRENTTPVLDSVSYQHFVGAEKDTSNLVSSFFTGFVYEVKVYNFAQEDPIDVTTPLCEDTAVRCTTCPITEACLAECEWNEFVVDNACNNCNS
jgi:hypothetical protein